MSQPTDKSKGGRPPAPPGLRRVHVPLRLPEWLVQWMAEQESTPAELIEAALLARHKLFGIRRWIKTGRVRA